MMTEAAARMDAVIIGDLAEGVGFEPTRDFHPCRFSRPVPSTTRPPLQDLYDLSHSPRSRDIAPALLERRAHALAWRSTDCRRARESAAQWSRDAPRPGPLSERAQQVGDQVVGRRVVRIVAIDLQRRPIVRNESALRQPLAVEALECLGNPVIRPGQSI